MSLIQDLRTRGRHRGKSPWQLVQTIGRLEREADDATCQLVAMATEVDGLRADRNRIAAEFEEQAVAHAAIVDTLTVHRDELLAEVTALKKRFGPELADEANANAVDVPRMARIGADQDTVPQGIDVITLREAADAGLLGAVTDPGRLPPSWARSEDDTQPIPAP
ncbi:hypothetical protein ABT099_23765 [Streptomyces prasinus]|uniref:hypothetical protein n=1 Tax=Streptomyces prasinus TaxID=67345 RepID=UPI00332F2B1F